MVPQDDLLSKEGRELLKSGRTIAEETQVVKILNATVMNRFEFVQFKDSLESNHEVIGQNDWFRFFRTSLELFYGQPVDSNLINIDNKGLTRKQLQMFERLQIHAQSITAIADQPPKFTDPCTRVLYDSKKAVALLHHVLSKTPVFLDGVLDDTVVFTGEDLKGFIEASSKLKKQIATQLDISIRKDIADKPVQQLGIFLKLLGLSIKKHDSYTNQGQKFYRYCLDSLELQEIRKWVEFRSDQSNIGWSYIDKTYGFNHTEYQFETFYRF